MWFDVPAAVMQLQAIGDNAPTVIRITERNAPKVAEIAEVAGLPAQNPKTVHVARTDGITPDARKYLDFLTLHGPSTYGASATALGWGATRVWQAEAQLRVAKLVRYDSLGKAVIEPDQLVSVAHK